MLDQLAIGRIRLRLVSFTLLLLAFSASNAATILIDFAEVTPESTFGDPLIVETQGFTFEAATLYAPGDNSVDANGISTEFEGCLFAPPGCGGWVTMENTAGNAFAVLSIGGYEGSFSGALAGGGFADLSVAIGTGDWLNLESLRVETICGEYCIGRASLDDITVNAVPIPAAFWLFGSALAGLGWLRRKQTA